MTRRTTRLMRGAPGRHRRVTASRARGVTGACYKTDGRRYRWVQGHPRWRALTSVSPAAHCCERHTVPQAIGSVIRLPLRAPCVKLRFYDIMHHVPRALSACVKIHGNSSRLAHGPTPAGARPALSLDKRRTSAGRSLSVNCLQNTEAFATAAAAVESARPSLRPAAVPLGGRHRRNTKL